MEHHYIHVIIHAGFGTYQFPDHPAVVVGVLGTKNLTALILVAYQEYGLSQLSQATEEGVDIGGSFQIPSNAHAHTVYDYYINLPLGYLVHNNVIVFQERALALSIHDIAFRVNPMTLVD